MSLIGCRYCNEPTCNGCNIYELGEALERGEFATVNGEVIIPAKRERSKWVWNYHNSRVCLLCGNPVGFVREEDGWHEGYYCGKCGADMRRAKTESEE